MKGMLESLLRQVKGKGKQSDPTPERLQLQEEEMVVVIEHHPRNREHQEPQEEEIVTIREKGQGKEDGTRDPQGEIGNCEEKRMKKTMTMREWLTRTS